MYNDLDPKEEAESIDPKDLLPERTAIYGIRCVILRGPFAGQQGIHTGTIQSPFGVKEVVFVDNIGEMHFDSEDVGFTVK